MARLSQALISGMMNPTYQKSLGSAVSGGFEQMQDAYEGRQNRLAMESANAMLTGGDVNDPNVQRSVQAVYSQMNQDPAEATALIRQQQAAERAVNQEERLARQAQRAQEQHKVQMQTAKWQEGQRTIANKERMIKGQVLGAVMKNPENVNQILSQVPEEFRGAAMDSVKAQLSYEKAAAELKDYARSKEPLNEAAIEMIGKTPGMDQAVAAYKEMSKQYPRQANAQLLRQWDQAHGQFVRSGQASKTPSAPAVENMLEIVEAQDFSAIPGWDGIPDEVVGPLAYRLAVKAQADPSFVPTPKVIEDEMNAMLAETPEGSTPPEAEESQEPQALPKGVTEEQVTYTMDKYNMTREQVLAELKKRGR